jgi:hypothetical protein
MVRTINLLSLVFEGLSLTALDPTAVLLLTLRRDMVTVEGIALHLSSVYIATARYFASMNSAMPCPCPPSRPMPLCLAPPNGRPDPT